MRVTIEKKTDQLNYEDFLGGVTRTVTVAGVKKGNREQQYDIQLEGDTRVWRPPATVLKLLVAAWGDDADKWIGRQAALYGDPNVRFGKELTGGIRVSHLSHIPEPFTIKLQVTRGKRADFTIEPLPTAPAAAPAAAPEPNADKIAALTTEWHTADDERKAAIEAEVKALRGEQA